MKSFGQEILPRREPRERLFSSLLINFLWTMSGVIFIHKIWSKLRSSWIQVSLGWQFLQITFVSTGDGVINRSVLLTVEDRQHCNALLQCRPCHNFLCFIDWTQLAIEALRGNLSTCKYFLKRRFFPYQLRLQACSSLLPFRGISSISNVFFYLCL